MATDSKGRPTPDYASMTPEQSAEILTEDFGENAEKVVDGQIQKAEKALKDAEKMKVDYTAEPNDIMEQEALKNQTIEAAKKQLDHAQNIKKAMTAKKVAETVGDTEQVEGAHEAGSVAAQKFVNAPRLVGNKRTRMLPDGETKIKGHYEIVPAESLTPSHDVNNGYKKSEGFPTDAEGRTVNDRDYEHDKAAQQNTDQIARKYNGMAIEHIQWYLTRVSYMMATVERWQDRRQQRMVRMANTSTTFWRMPRTSALLESRLSRVVSSILAW